MSITQKDVHDYIVQNASPLQKAYISMQCGYDPLKIQDFEQVVANILNSITKSISNADTDYLKK